MARGPAAGADIESDDWLSRSCTENAMKTCTRTLTALSLAAGLALNGMTLAQTPTPTVTPNANNKVPPMTPDSTKSMDKAMDGAGVSATMQADALVGSQLLTFASMPEEKGDAKFALVAGLGNQQEIEIGQFVAGKAQDPAVKELASTLAKEHGMAQDKLKPIAEKLGVKYPDTLPAMPKSMLVAYQNMPVEKMEKAFLSAMKGDHLKTAGFYADHIPMLKDADLKAYATETLPHIRAHTAQIIEQNAAKGLNVDMDFAKDKHAGHGM